MADTDLDAIRLSADVARSEIGLSGTVPPRRAESLMTSALALCDEVEQLRAKEDDLTEVAMRLDGQRVDALEEAERLRDWQNEVIGALLSEELDDNEHRAEIALETLTRHMSDLNTRVADVALLRAVVARVRALLREEWVHAYHEPDDPDIPFADCAGCWSHRLRAALDGGAS